MLRIIAKVGIFMRKYYLDNIRWATVAVVVVYHVFYMYSTESITTGLGRITDLEHQYYDVILYIVYPWIMMVLFMVSGICSRLYLERHTDREFVRSRTNRLLVPSTVGLFAFQFIQGWLNAALSDAFGKMPGVPLPGKIAIIIASGTGVLWYIQLLWVYSMLLVLIRKADKDRLWNKGGRAGIAVLTAMVIPTYLAAQVLNTPVIVVYRFGLYFFVFLFGYFVLSHDEAVEVLKKWFPLFLGLAVILGAAFCIRYFGQNYADKPVNRTPLFVSYGCFACMAIIGGAARYADFQNAFTKWMSDRNFGLYVFHYLGISAVAYFLAKPGLLPAAAIYLLSLIAGFGGAYLLNAVISRLPFFRWAVLGITKKDKEGGKNAEG